MKKLLYIPLLTFIAILSFTACSKDSTDEEEKKPPVDTLAQYKTQGQHLRRSIIAYMCGDNNNIGTYLKEDVKEMIEGSKQLQEDCRLILLSDFDNQPPRISEIRQGREVVMREYEKDFYVTSPDSMLSIMKWIISNYPADEYATVFGGHGSGAIIENDTIKTNLVTLKAYGPDGTATTPANRQWINIPSMARVFSNLPKMEYIFFDCCAMGNVETVYELRNAAHYIIAPVSETPGDGAPYKTIVPILSLDRMLVGSYIIDHYIQDTNFGSYDGICISCVKTDELENLRKATYDVLRKFPQHPGTNRLQFNIRYCVYYYNVNRALSDTPILHDMKSVFTQNGLSADDMKEWEKAVNKAVVARYPKTGTTSFRWKTSMRVNEGGSISDYTFTLNDDNYCGLSMIVPFEDYNSLTPNLNKSMYDLQWTNAMDWKSLGW